MSNKNYNELVDLFQLAVEGLFSFSSSSSSSYTHSLTRVGIALETREQQLLEAERTVEELQSKFFFPLLLQKKKK